ncbi:hypothetical protein V6N11_022669 [Hibiscus sabdariffa]|uniref:Uncharacterized protein n=1 Tax=Hibiscus sabdariffa TaxID=183260 RepID=A0ABR2TK35_9ROSI
MQPSMEYSARWCWEVFARFSIPLKLSDPVLVELLAVKEATSLFLNSKWIVLPKMLVVYVPREANECSGKLAKSATSGKSSLIVSNG